MRIGLFFGSFNPIHNGHLMIANYVVQFTGIEQVWFVISPQNPFKQAGELLSEDHRYAMVKLAIDGAKNYRACTIEFDMPRPSYTYRTLEALLRKFPRHEFSLLMGGDNLPGLVQWRRAQWIMENFAVLVYPRKGFEYGQLKPYFEQYQRLGAKDISFVRAPLIEVSATFIRTHLQAGKDLRFFLHPRVYQYIVQNRLYGSK